MDNAELPVSFPHYDADIARVLQKELWRNGRPVSRWRKRPRRLHGHRVDDDDYDAVVPGASDLMCTVRLHTKSSAAATVPMA